MSIKNTRRALVTGANRGIGFEIAKKLVKNGVAVILGVRDAEKGETSCARLLKEGLQTDYQVMEVTNRESVAKGVSAIKKQFGPIDILVNNAGIRLDFGQTIMDLSQNTLLKTFHTNLLGPLFLTQAVLPDMKKNNFGRIVNMASSLGSLSEITDPHAPGYEVESPAYRLSKTAINGLTALFAKEVRGYNILVNSACPGWVKTELGGEAAPLRPDQGADTPVWLATLPDGGPSGGFFRERKPLAW